MILSGQVMAVAANLCCRICHIRVLCGSLPAELHDLEMRLKCLVELKKTALEGEDKENGVWSSLGDLIGQTNEAVEGIINDLEKASAGTTQKLLYHLKTFLGAGAEDSSRLIQRLSRQLQVVLASVGALHQIQLVDEAKTTNQLLSAVFRIQMKRQDEIEKSLGKFQEYIHSKSNSPRPPSYTQIFSDDPNIDNVTLKSDTKVHLSRLYSKSQNVFQGTVTVRNRSTQRSRSVCDETLFKPPEDLHLPSTVLQADEEDRHLLIDTLKLPKGASLRMIEKALRRKGFDIQVLPKPFSGFLEIGYRPKSLLFTKSLRYKARWFVLYPNSDYLVFYKSPHDVDVKPEKGRIPLIPSNLQEHHSLPQFFIHSHGQAFTLRAESRETALQWKDRIIRCQSVL